MKLRIRGHSIRLRLGRSEVARLVAGDVVAEVTTFDPLGRQRLEYHLVATADVTRVAASFEAGQRLVVRVPTDLARSWGTTDRIGIAATQPAADGATLRILIEKDLECLDAPAEESQADAFARAAATLACSPPAPQVDGSTR